MTRVLRLVSFAIAIAGILDPAITVSGAARARVAVVTVDPGATAVSVRDRIARDLAASYDVVPAITTDTAAAVMVGDRYPDPASFGAAINDGLIVATVTTDHAFAKGARLVRVDVPRDVPAATVIHVDILVEARALVGQTTDASVSIGGLEVGRASHKWTADGERWRAGIDAVPVGDPPYAVQVQLPPSPDGSGAAGKPDTTEPEVVSGFSRTVDVVVGLRRDPIRVEFYDPRPSWATTFVRRALEADARFQVATLSFTSRGISTQSGGAVPLGDLRLDSFDAVVVGGLDRLSGPDARALERFMRERGGLVVVIPDQRIDAGPARDLVGAADLSERLLEQPAKLAVMPPAPAIEASELLALRALPSGADVVARLPGADSLPVIVSSPRGDGRLLISGAMDAWRYRAADNAAFDRFWQSTIAGLALAVPPAIAIDLDPPLLRPGESGSVIARLRSRDVTAVNASIDGQPLRLLPGAEAGVYRGAFVASHTPGRSTIEVHSAMTSQPLAASRTLLVQPDVQRLRPTTAPALSLLAQSHHGIDVTPARVSDLERFLRTAVTAPPVLVARHPMRSVWWILPFAGCLSAEWWLRRRRGLR